MSKDKQGTLGRTSGDHEHPSWQKRAEPVTKACHARSQGEHLLTCTLRWAVNASGTHFFYSLLGITATA